jgi:tetratricopeptide (TPR) repeat protein
MESCLRQKQAGGMKVIHCLLLLLPPFTFPLLAQRTTSAPLIQAAKLNNEGQFHSTVALLEPMLRLSSPGLNPDDAGVGWNLLGSAYQELGDHDHARQSYETAIQILKELPGEELQYASALDNLGSVEFDAGQAGSSRILRQEARKVYVAGGDHAGIARTSSNLALIELQQGHRRKAESELAEAFRESGLVQPPDADDLAAMYTIRCSLAAREGNIGEAFAEIDQAIRLWTGEHGEHYYLLPAGYSLRGQAYAELGEFRQAREDMLHALALLKETTGSNTPAYFVTEIAYAHVLQKSGSEQEAESLEKGATASLESFRRQQCADCTVRFWSFH